MTPAPKFADLAPRILSAVFLLAVSGLGLWLGGLILAFLLSVFGALMLWEYFRLIVRLSLPFAMGAALLASALLCISLILQDRFAISVSVPQSADEAVLSSAVASPVLSALIFLTLSILAVVAAVHQSKLEAVFGAMIPLATFLFFYLHQSVPQAMWLVVGTVIAVDIAGYFFGKLIGGPKFWPSLSPNKTWAGSASGWVCATLLAIVASWGEPTETMVLGIIFLGLVAVAAQMADIAESALKRRAGVKDSSHLLPGHGGLLDRFDGMLGGFTVAGLAFILMGYAMVPG